MRLNFFFQEVINFCLQYRWSRDPKSKIGNVVGVDACGMCMKILKVNIYVTLNIEPIEYVCPVATYEQFPIKYEPMRFSASIMRSGYRVQFFGSAKFIEHCYKGTNFWFAYVGLCNYKWYQSFMKWKGYTFASWIRRHGANHSAAPVIVKTYVRNAIEKPFLQWTYVLG